jgi:hypothetical protein
MNATLDKVTDAGQGGRPEPLPKSADAELLEGVLLDAPAMNALSAVNEGGQVEKVFYHRDLNGYDFSTATPARVLKRGDRKIKVVCVRRKPGSASLGPASVSAWAFYEAWVQTQSVTPRADDAPHAARIAFPTF